MSVVIQEDYQVKYDIFSDNDLSILASLLRSVQDEIGQLNTVVLIDKIEFDISETIPNSYTLVIVSKDAREWTQVIDTSDPQNSFNTYTTEAWSEREITQKRVMRRLLMQLVERYQVTRMIVEFK